MCIHSHTNGCKSLQPKGLHFSHIQLYAQRKALAQAAVKSVNEIIGADASPGDVRHSTYKALYVQGGRKET